MKKIYLLLLVIFLGFKGYAQVNWALTATASHSGGGATVYAASNYNDGVIAANSGTCASSATPWGWVTSSGWINFTWASPVTFNKIVLYKSNRPMLSCTMQYWTGSAWVTFYTYSVSSTCTEDSITFAPVTTTQLQFQTVGGSSNPNHREIQVWQTGTAAPTVTGTPTVCSGSTLSLTASSGATSPTFSWTGPAGFTATTAAISIPSMTSANAGVYSVTVTSGGSTSSPTTVTVTVNPSPVSITGNACIIQGSTSTLSDGTSGGTWSSDNTSIATIGAGTGVGTGVAAGTANISYTLGTGCAVGYPVTVSALSGITLGTGTSSVCLGSGGMAYDATSGGTWVSSSGALTIGSSSGSITGISLGTAIISYSIPSGCSVALPVTVVANPASISGSSVVCAGASTTLSDATTGGTWTSGSTSVATISGGSVTGVSSGSTVITYTMPTGCYATQAMTVNADAAITGSASVCNGFSTPLSNGTPGGGTWSSSAPSVASISTSGVVTGVSIGSALISFTATTTGCATTLTFNVTPPPSAYTMTGGGGYCIGSTTGIPIGLSGSGLGVSYTLFNGATVVGTATGTGGAISFGTATYAAGTYTAIAAYSTACANTMLGTAVVTINSLPTTFTVTGGGTYCIGGTGTAVGLSSSTIGVNYQLYVGGTPIGSAVAGTGGAISFGLQTITGTYTVIATNATTYCTSAMTGSVTVSTNPLPTAYSVTPATGSFCLGGTGVVVGLSGSTIGTNYQLFLGGSPVGGLVPGTGSSISFGLQATAGTYTVSATNTTTTCTNIMSGSSVITISPLPTAYTVNVSGTGSYCAGGTGVTISLSGSQGGVNYQLVLGTTPVGAPIAGTGAAISFGLITASGSYSVVATNTSTLCTNNMTGSVSVTVLPLPPSFSMTGGGGYCAGGPGVPVGLSGSASGVNYQLFNGTTLIGGASGTGAALGFGNQTLPGTYTVVATNTTTGCVGNMAGSVTVVVNPLPTTFNVSGGGNFCAGGTGVVVGLTGSTAGVNYQLYNGSVPVGSLTAGTGIALSFGIQAAAGSYTAVGINPSTGCTSNMAGSQLITINPLPTVYTITGGGGYCAGGAGVTIGLSGSNSSISYQLYNTAGAVGAPVIGTGGAISFGLQTTASTRDSVVATNPGTSCISVMSGNVPVSINPLPVQFSVTGGGGYCSGGTGLTVNLGGSVTGVIYQLYNGVVPSGAPIAGTGSPLIYGPVTGSGTYTVIATTLSNSCTNNMVGSASISINPLPTVFSVTGGGTYCAGTGGLHVVLSSSVSGINYQLYNSGLPVGSLVPGTGIALDLGTQTAAGTYTVVAITPGTLCQNNMSGSVNIVVNPLPSVYTVTQTATSYCAGGTGVHIGLSSSSVGVSYQLKTGGIPSGAPVAGNGSAIDFGLRTAAGSYTVVATNTTTGCTSNMTGTATIAVNTLPPAQTMLPGGSYCPGGAGVILGLSGSNTGISYTLYNGPTSTGISLPGTGLPVSFGAQTAPGTYTVVGTNTGTGCTNNMTGSAIVSIYAIPTVYNVTGGGNYCIGGTGVNIGLSNSTTGVLYQLFDASAPMGAPVAGTGSAISFGLQSTTGTYTVIANSGTSCSNTMFGSAIVGTNPLPSAFNVTGGGNYCSGGTGVSIGLDGSATGTVYSLFTGGLPSGGTVSGTGSAISFGNSTASGSYTVIATTTATGCTNTMTGTAAVGINPLPSGFLVGGGGNYCAGSGGADVTLMGSDPGATYQLYHGTAMVGVALPGTGSGLDFGLQAATGTYSVKATNSGTGCEAMMTGTVNVGINPLPTPFIVTGGGNYCSGSTGVHVMLSGSNIGVSYEIRVDGGPIGVVMAGTGSALDFGPQYAAGTYTVEATSTTSGCKNTMTGSVVVVINPLPAVYTATGSSSSYCTGGSGVAISLSNTDLGISYQVYNGTVAIGTAIAGTGAGISFGYVTATGTYTIKATNTVTGCTDNMTPNLNVIISPLPAVHTVTGGGNYCSGGTGVPVGLSSSNSGINYQLYSSGGVAVGAVVPGTGSALDFGLQTAAGTYTVVGVNNATGCSSNMAGSASVIINALPTLYTTTGSGSFCAGGSGIALGLSGSALGVSYQLQRGGVATGSPVSGTGTSFSFGSVTIAGTYTVKATSGIGCSVMMTGSSVVGVNPVPVAYPVTGGGNYCPGGTGVTVGLSGSSSGINYQLFVGTMSVGASVSGTPGTPINFGLQTTPGTYTVVASDISTGCTSSMTGYRTVGLNPLPTAYAVTGGGNYCAGGAGVDIGLNNTEAGVSYTLLDSPSIISTLTGTGSPLDFGYQTTAGTYTVLGTNSTTGCSAIMSGVATVIVNPMVTPVVTVSNLVGDTICSGSYTTFTATPSNGGSAPSFLWSVNGTVVGVGNGYNYIPLNGDAVSVTMTSNAACATPAVVTGYMIMTVYPKETPTVTASLTPGTSVCHGTSVTYTADYTYGGTAPVFTWLKNGTAMSTASSFSYIPSNNDNVYCVMTSNYNCRLANTASTSHFIMNVAEPLTPVVTISANPGANIGAGDVVTLTATILNGGPSPVISWLKNGMEIPGATGGTISSLFSDGDSVTCQVLSSGSCSGLIGFNSITFHVANVGVKPVTLAGSNLTLIPNPNNGQFTIKGNVGTASEEVTLQVVNMLGQVIYNQKVIARNGDINEKVQLTGSLANGMYLLNMQSASENRVFHFVIEQ